MVNTKVLVTVEYLENLILQVFVDTVAGYRKVFGKLDTVGNIQLKGVVLGKIKSFVKGILITNFLKSKFAKANIKIMYPFHYPIITTCSFSFSLRLNKNTTLNFWQKSTVIFFSIFFYLFVFFFFAKYKNFVFFYPCCFFFQFEA